MSTTKNQADGQRQAGHTQRLIQKQEAWQKLWGMTASPRALMEIERLENAITQAEQEAR